MAHLSYSKTAFRDLDRLIDFLVEIDPSAAATTVDLILQAVEILEQHPLIGRLVENGLRELVISRGHSGYVALYSYQAVHDAVLSLALRHQREAGI